MRMLIVFLLLCNPALAQPYPPYGGGPYRPNPRDWGPDERARRIPPPRGGYDIPPCIRTGECSGPPRMPPFRDRRYY